MQWVNFGFWVKKKKIHTLGEMSMDSTLELYMEILLLLGGIIVM